MALANEIKMSEQKHSHVVTVVKNSMLSLYGRPMLRAMTML